MPSIAFERNPDLDTENMLEVLEVKYLDRELEQDPPLGVIYKKPGIEGRYYADKRLAELIGSEYLEEGYSNPHADYYTISHYRYLVTEALKRQGR